MVNKLRDFCDGLANHEKYYSQKSNKHALAMHMVTHSRKLLSWKFRILQKVAESRNLCATEIWSYTVRKIMFSLFSYIEKV